MKITSYMLDGGPSTESRSEGDEPRRIIIVAMERLPAVAANNRDDRGYDVIDIVASQARKNRQRQGFSAEASAEAGRSIGS